MLQILMDKLEMMESNQLTLSLIRIPVSVGLIIPGSVPTFNIWHCHDQMIVKTSLNNVKVRFRIKTEEIDSTDSKVFTVLLIPIRIGAYSGAMSKWFTWNVMIIFLVQICLRIWQNLDHSYAMACNCHY